MAFDMGFEEMTRSGRKNCEKHAILYDIFMSVGVVGVGVGVVGVCTMFVRCRCDVSAMFIRGMREGVPSKNLAQIQSKSDRYA